MNKTEDKIHELQEDLQTFINTLSTNNIYDCCSSIVDYIENKYEYIVIWNCLVNLDSYDFATTCKNISDFYNFTLNNINDFSNFCFKFKMNEVETLIYVSFDIENIDILKNYISKNLLNKLSSLEKSNPVYWLEQIEDIAMTEFDLVSSLSISNIKVLEEFNIK